MVLVRRTSVADAAVLAELAARTFREAFEEGNTAEDLELYLEQTYGVEQQTRELEDEAIVTLLAEIEGVAVGFAQLQTGKPPACVDDDAVIELGRFYVDRPWHGQGVAQALMDAVLAAARLRGARTLWLGVWERNPRAIAFYAKCGFADVGSKPFLVGTDLQTDRVMARRLR